MATIDGLTKVRMLAIEAASVISGVIVGNDLILTKHDGSTVDAGNVRGPIGNTGLTGATGPTGVPGNLTVAAATSVNDSLTGLAARDGYTPSAADLILVTGQATPSQNGIYSAAAGAWSRWASAATALQVASLGVIQVRHGSVYGGSQFVTSFNQDQTLGTNDQLWSEIATDRVYDHTARIADLTGTLIHFPEGGAGGAYSYSLVSYYKDEVGVVYCVGLLTNISAAITLGTTLFTLPKGCRPGKTLRFLCVAGDGTRTVLVRPTGEVVLAGAIGSITTGTAMASGGYLSFDSIHFPAEDVPNPPVWTDLTSLLINGWANVGTVGGETYANIRMWMDAVGDTHVQGVLKNTSSTTPLQIISATPAAFHTQGSWGSLYIGAGAYYNGSIRVDYHGETTTGEFIATYVSGVGDYTALSLDNMIIPTSKNPSKWRKYNGFINSWTVYASGTFGPPQFYKNTLGRIYNRGLMASGTLGLTFSPSFLVGWFSPRAIRVVAAIAYLGSARLDAIPVAGASNGIAPQVYFNSGSNAFVSLTDMQWDTAAR